MNLSDHPQKKHQDLANMHQLCALFDHPQNAFPTIHIAGTNGKGSVCTKIAAALQKEGYKTGLYTSPHISTFRERIQINGQMISEEEVTFLLSQVNQTATFFEIATLLAFLHFKHHRIDVAVIETGIGGRLDATNVITPILSVVTSIGFDHMDLLGPTILDIAHEKAGIIKKMVPLVIGPDVPYSFMKVKAEHLGCPFYQSAFQNEDFDLENQEISRLALSLLHDFPTSPESVNEGLKAKPPCRFESHKRKKEIIFDVAHNSHGFSRLLQRLSLTYPNHDYRFVIGFSKGKDISECARLIEEKAHAVHLVGGSHPRLAQVSEIQTSFANPEIETSIGQGIQNALNASNPKQEVIVIAGSFFIMADARKAIGLTVVEEFSFL